MVLIGFHGRQPRTQLGVGRQPRVQQLEKVALYFPQPRVVHFGQLHVLEGQVIQVQHLPAEQGGVFQQSLGGHHTVDASLHQATLHIFPAVDSSVGEDWDGQLLLDELDYFPVAGPDCILVLLLRPAVDRQDGAPCSLYLLGQLDSFLTIL